MDLKPGDVVMLKSGGHPMTVADLRGAEVVCVWMGDDGDLFRESLPVAVLEPAEIDPPASDDDDEEDDEDEARDAKVAS